ncbi:MAG: hypothetical protein EOM68_30955 [Spirochaetia bacterium]|nr:hypothetical protein [Spirochaetia bacterium]
MKNTPENPREAAGADTHAQEARAQAQKAHEAMQKAAHESGTVAWNLAAMAAAGNRQPGDSSDNLTNTAAEGEHWAKKARAAAKEAEVTAEQAAEAAARANKLAQDVAEGEELMRKNKALKEFKKKKDTRELQEFVIQTLQEEGGEMFGSDLGAAIPWDLRYVYQEDSGLRSFLIDHMDDEVRTTGSGPNFVAVLLSDDSSEASSVSQFAV